VLTVGSYPTRSAFDAQSVLHAETVGIIQLQALTIGRDTPVGQEIKIRWTVAIRSPDERP
jgi:hypothetical protein